MASGVEAVRQGEGVVGPARRRSLRTLILTTLSLAVGVPLALAFVLGWRLLVAREGEGTARGLTNYGVAVARRVEAHLSTHLDAVRALARSVEDVGRFDAPAMDAAIASVHAIYPGFHTMVAVDAEGSAFAGHPHTARDGTPLPFPVSAADRAYFRQPMADGRPYVSSVFQGRSFGTHPIVAVSAPVVRQGRPIGVMEGSLDVARLPLLEGLVGDERFDVVVTDGTGTVVYATPRTGLAPLQPTASLPVGLAPSVPSGEVFRFTVGATPFVAVKVPVGIGGWSVIAQQQEAVATSSSRGFLATMMLVALAGMAAAIAFGVLAASGATRLLVRLEGEVGRFLSGAAPEPIVVPPGAPREMAELVAGFEEMQRRLGKTLSGLLPVCAWCKRIKDGEGQWTSMEAYVSSHSSAEITHGMCVDCAARFEQAAHDRAARPPGA